MAFWMLSMWKRKSAQRTVIIQSEENDIKVQRNRGVCFLICFLYSPFSAALSLFSNIGHKDKNGGTRMNCKNKDGKGNNRCHPRKGLLHDLCQECPSALYMNANGGQKVIMPSVTNSIFKHLNIPKRKK